MQPLKIMHWPNKSESNRQFWFLWAKDESKHYLTFALEWVFGKKAILWLLHFTTGNHDGCGISFSIAIPHLFGLYLTLELKAWHYLFKDSHEYGFSIHDGCIWWSLGCDEWHEKGPRVVWHVTDWLFGKNNYSDQTLLKTYGTVTLEEGTYPVHIRMFLSTWKRSRWPWPERLIRADMDVQNEGIPVAGHGENEWDQGDDAIFSMTCPAKTPEEGLIKLRESIIQDRQDHGMPTSLQGAKTACP